MIQDKRRLFVETPVRGLIEQTKKDSYNRLNRIYFCSNYLFVFYLKLQDQYNDKVY